MHFIKWAAIAALALTIGTDSFGVGALAQTQAQATAPAAGSKNILAWAAKPAHLPPYTGPNKLVYRLADVLAAHRGKASWQQEVFLSRDYAGAWISMAPGEKTKTQFYADDRVFWVVQSGQMKVTIEGQEPFIASKHFLIQVPKRLQYSMEVVGNEPALRFEMRPAGESPDYPLSETPTPVKGVEYIKAVYSGHGNYDGKVNIPYSILKSRSCRAARSAASGCGTTTTMSPSCARPRARQPRPTMCGATSMPTSRKSG